MAVSPLRNRSLGRLALLLVVAVVLRLLLVFCLPPLLDVYYYDSQAVHAFLVSSDPYGHLYSGIPSWLATPGAESVYAYLPGVVLFLAPFGALWDVRLGLIVADLVIAWTLCALEGRWSGAAAAIFILAPWSFLFSTSYPNNTLVAMAFLGLALLYEARDDGLVSATALGVSMASSQFVWLLYPLFLLRYIRRRRIAEAATGPIVAALLMLPFLLLDPPAFLYDTFAFQFSRPVQSIVTPEAFGFNLNLTLSGIAQTAFGITVPLLLKVGILLALLALLLHRCRNLPSLVLNASFFLLASLFILPVDFSLWYLELPFQTFLTWFVPSHNGPPPAEARGTSAKA